MKWSIVVGILLLSGCMTLPGSARYGYKSYDPCIKCGEKWDQFPNERFEAQKRRARENSNADQD